MSCNYTEVRPEAPAPLYDLTVITVCRNALPGLQRTVHSVTAAKAAFPKLRIEHLVVDGASTDGTPAWLQEQYNGGRIEAFMSEPDAGIYDAMNKGINAARGRVLWFLNADDVLAPGGDLESCVRPILEGRSDSVAAGVIYAGGKVKFPKPEMLYLSTFCSHQAYFATADLYRRLGGYEARSFRCCADADFMNKAVLTGGEPVLLDSLIAEMAPDGVSAGCSTRYLHEYSELMYRYREPMLHRATLDPNYRELLVWRIFRACILLRDWQERQQKDIPAELRHLSELCEAFAAQSPAGALCKAMRFIARAYLPHLCHHRRASRLIWLRLRRHMGVITCSETNPYREEMDIPEISLGRTLRYYTRRLLGLPTE